MLQIGLQYLLPKLKHLSGEAEQKDVPLFVDIISRDETGEGWETERRPLNICNSEQGVNLLHFTVINYGFIEIRFYICPSVLGCSKQGVLINIVILIVISNRNHNSQSRKTLETLAEIDIPPQLSWLEHLTVNQRVLGSSPRGGASLTATLHQ